MTRLCVWFFTPARILGLLIQLRHTSYGLAEVFTHMTEVFSASNLVRASLTVRARNSLTQTR